MIVEYLLKFIFGVMASVLEAILPDFSTAIPDLSGVFAGMLTLNQFFPLSESLSAALTIWGVSQGIFFVKLTQQLISHIPGVGGSGG